MASLINRLTHNPTLDLLSFKRRLSVLFGIALLPLFGGATVDGLGWDQGMEFTVVAYNVENLFDVDGIAMFEDYQQDERSDPFTYTRTKLLTKLQNHTEVLQYFNDGAGPEVILFQEFEADFTPRTSVDDFDAFLAEYRHTTVEDMLGDGWRSVYKGIPSQAWLLKAMADAGVDGYHVVTVPSKGMDSGIAHANAVFSKFPITSSEAHELEQARDILEVQLDVAGNSLWVYSNHWKSGASNPKREPIRVQNATILRKLIDARLAEDPHADIIIGGDLNSHYNHSLLFPEITTGINNVLGSQGDELAIRAMDGVDLYNLWFELPPEERYTEVWRGRRGTLMHLLITRGLYDESGIQYVDGSFDKLLMPGFNIDTLGRPLEWSFAGNAGGGVTDHLPVYARFKVSSGESGVFVDLENPSAGDDAPDFEMPLGYMTDPSVEFEDGAFLSEIGDADLGPYMGKLYKVDAKILKMRPLTLEIGDAVWGAYAPGDDLQAELACLSQSSTHRLIVKLGVWKGKRQFVVEGLRQ